MTRWQVHDVAFFPEGLSTKTMRVGRIDCRCAPELIRAEVTNVLRRFERAKEITEQESNAAYDDFMKLDLELHTFEPFSERIWQLRHNVVTYDAWYVALAEALAVCHP